MSARGVRNLVRQLVRLEYCGWSNKCPSAYEPSIMQSQLPLDFGATIFMIYQPCFEGPPAVNDFQAMVRLVSLSVGLK